MARSLASGGQIAGLGETNPSPETSFRKMKMRMVSKYEGGLRSLLIGFLYRVHRDCRSRCPEIREEAQAFVRHDPCFRSVCEYLGLFGSTDEEIISRAGRD